jgi:hypothetical protein
MQRTPEKIEKLPLLRKEREAQESDSTESPGRKYFQMPTTSATICLVLSRAAVMFRIKEVRSIEMDNLSDTAWKEKLRSIIVKSPTLLLEEREQLYLLSDLFSEEEARELFLNIERQDQCVLCGGGDGDER